MSIYKSINQSINQSINHINIVDTKVAQEEKKRILISCREEEDADN